MPQIESQAKRVLTNRKAQLRNRSQKSALRTEIRSLHSAIEANDVETAKQILNTINSKLDQGVTSNIHHKNFASRQKSTYAKLVNSIS